MSTPEKPSTISPLDAVWQEAAERMEHTVPDQEWGTVMDITERTRDPELVAEFREKHRNHLTPESVFFLEMSEAAKRANIEQRK